MNEIGFDFMLDNEKTRMIFNFSNLHDIILFFIEQYSK